MFEILGRFLIDTPADHSVCYLQEFLVPPIEMAEQAIDRLQQAIGAVDMRGGDVFLDDITYRREASAGRIGLEKTIGDG